VVAVFDFCVPFAIVITDGSQVLKSASFVEYHFDQFILSPEVQDGNSGIYLTCCSSWTGSPVCYSQV
jgi:hypothetical protein